MKVIQLPDVLYTYLLELIEMHAGRGIHPEEGMAVNRLWDAVKNRATHIDEGDIQKMAAAASPAGQSSVGEIDPRNPHGQPVECEKCFDEEGSLACIRPAHKARQTEPVEGT